MCCGVEVKRQHGGASLGHERLPIGTALHSAAAQTPTVSTRSMATAQMRCGVERANPVWSVVATA